MDSHVIDNRRHHRFEMDLGHGKLAFISYRPLDERTYDLVHTDVPEEFEGQGIGTRLARGTLDLIRGQGGRIVPTCSFVATWLKRHPDYSDLRA